MQENAYMIKLTTPYELIDKIATIKEKEYFDLDDMAVKIAVKLITYRIKNNMTQRELAQFLGISKSTVSKLESGEYYPSIKLLYKISRTLGFDFTIEFDC